jgi:hypothetical protein
VSGGHERADEREAEDYERPKDVPRRGFEISRNLVACARDHDPENPDKESDYSGESAERPGQA